MVLGRHAFALDFHLVNSHPFKLPRVETVAGSWLIKIITGRLRGWVNSPFMVETWQTMPRRKGGEQKNCRGGEGVIADGRGKKK